MLPVSVRRHLQRAYFSDWKTRSFPRWPVDFAVDNLHAEILEDHDGSGSRGENPVHMVLARRCP